MRFEIFIDTHRMLCEIRKAFDAIKMSDCYYHASLRRTLSELISAYYDGMSVDRERHVFYTWADHLTELSLVFANESFSKNDGTNELYADWCLGMAENIYDILPVPEIAEGSLSFAKDIRKNGYVETDFFSDWH